MATSREFPNLKLEHLKSYDKFQVLVAFGYRTAILLDSNLEIICRYLDSNKTENFHCAAFYEIKFNPNSNTIFNKNSLYLLIAGESGVIKIIDLNEGKLTTFLKGHTGSIYDLKVVDDYLISSGEDSSIRIWNLKTLKCIAVCGGLDGHKDYVLSVDVMSDLSLIVSAGTDSVIKQWQFNKLNDSTDHFIDKSDVQLIHNPFSSFNNVHKCIISKVKYWGNLILSLSNNLISVIYNHKDESNNDQSFENLFNLNKNDPIYIGTVEFFGNCKNFDICGNILIGISTNADLYFFDLKNVIKEKSPYLVSTEFSSAEDIVCSNNSIFITSGDSIHKVNVNLDHFN
jgi:WD40 repeat protein